jgi:hypothetical protein
MNKPKTLELLKMILTSIKSDDVFRKSWNTKSTYLDDNRNQTDESALYYDITIGNKDMEHVFDIRISKIKGIFIDRYITKITTRKANDRYSSEKNMYFDSDKSYSFTRRIQKSIFKILSDREKNCLNKEDDDKFNVLIRDVHKSVNKVNLRDDKIDEVLK